MLSFLFCFFAFLHSLVSEFSSSRSRPSAYPLIGGPPPPSFLLLAEGYFRVFSPPPILFPAPNPPDPLCSLNPWPLSRFPFSFSSSSSPLPPLVCSYFFFFFYTALFFYYLPVFKPLLQSTLSASLQSSSSLCPLTRPDSQRCTRGVFCLGVRALWRTWAKRWE